jgi:isopenicillin N synthase-like dioxygenase
MGVNVVGTSKVLSGLPIVDISKLRNDDFASRQQVAQQIRAACLDKGFFYISGHGISAQLIEDVFAQTKLFFDMPLDRKMDLDKARSKANRGYEPLSSQRLEEGTAPDLKESYFIGSELALDDPRMVRGQFGRGPNQWPEALPNFQATMERYYAAMTELGGRLYKTVALSLGLEESYFDSFYQEPLNTLRMIHYPPQPANPDPDQKGCGAHTDFGGLTLLLQDSVGGLQVRDEASGAWIDAKPVADTYVVNLGDFISLWTNNTYRSTLHRVINTSGRERYSVPFFVNGDPDFQVSCMLSCLTPGETPKHPPTTITEHFNAMFCKTHLR